MDINAFDMWVERRRAARAFKLLNGRKRVKKDRKERAAPAIAMDARDCVGMVHERPLIRALNRTICQWREGSMSDVMGQIKSVIASFAERDPSAVAWLSLVRADGTLEPIVFQDSVRSKEYVSAQGPGIVPRVARTGVPYVTGNTLDDPYYTEVFENILSEEAIAIDVKWDDGQRFARYVVNLESKQPARYHPASVELLRQYSEAELIPLLRERELLKSGCCWNPRRHGWGVREFLSSLLQQVKERIADGHVSNIHFVIWYVDQEDRIVAPLASTGFTHGIRFRESLSFGDAGIVGEIATADDWKSATWDQSYNPLRPGDPDDMGVRISRFIVTPESVAHSGNERFRLVFQVVAFAPESERIVPDNEELRHFAEAIYDQVLGYLCLYPALAADAIRRAIHEAGSFPEQCRAVAKTIETVLRAAAVTVYARPWRDKGILHAIAATAPLKRANGTSLAPDPDSSPILGLLPSGHTAWDIDSYAGTLVSRPGCSLRRNSYRHSGERMLREDFPLKPSLDYSESLAQTEGSDPRFVGYSLPNPSKPTSNSTGVALAVRPVDRAPFKCWDSVAMKMMFGAAAPVIQSWRDWAAIRLGESQVVIEETCKEHRRILGSYALSVDHGKLPCPRAIGSRYETTQTGILQAMLTDRLSRIERVWRRRPDPIPRVGSRAAFSREIAAQAYERAGRALMDDRMRSLDGDVWSANAFSAVPMEARGTNRAVMHPVAFFHERMNVAPKMDAPNDPRRLRLPPDLVEDWQEFLNDGKPREFNTVVRIPFLAWIGQHAARGALTLDLPAEVPAGANDLRMDLLLLTRKLAAAWTVSGSRIPHGKFVSQTSRIKFIANLKDHLRAESVELYLGDQSADRERSAGEWATPMIVFERSDRREKPDADAELFGIQEIVTERTVALRIPLHFGMFRVGEVITHWSRDSLVPYTQMERALWVRDILAAWNLWSWSWTSEGHGNHDDSLVCVDVCRENDGEWKLTHHFPQGLGHSGRQVVSEDGARRVFDLLYSQ